MNNDKNRNQPEGGGAPEEPNASAIPGKAIEAETPIATQNPPEQPEHQSEKQFWSQLNIREWVTTLSSVGAALAAVASCYVAWKTYGQLDAQRQIMGNQLNSMNESGADTHSLAVSASQQLAITMVQLKPQLVFNLGGPPQLITQADGTRGWWVTPTWENHGATDAAELWSWDNANIFHGDAPAKFNFLHHGRDDNKIRVSSGQKFSQISKFITLSNVSDIIEGKSKFIIWGYLEYREELPGNKFHHVHWCFEVVPEDIGRTITFSSLVYRPECNKSD